MSDVLSRWERLTCPKGLEVRAFDSDDRLVYRRVIPPRDAGNGYSVRAVDCRGGTCCRIETRAVNFDRDGRPDWTMHTADCYGHGLLSYEDGESRSRYVSTEEAIHKLLTTPQPSPWKVVPDHDNERLNW